MDYSEKYSKIASSPYSFQSKVFKVISPRVKARIWLIHLSKMIDSYPYQEMQLEVIEDSVNVLRYFAKTEVPDELWESNQERIRSIARAIPNVFDNELAINTFVKISSVKFEADKGMCNCHYSPFWNGCPSGKCVAKSYNYCEGIYTGCSFFGWFVCNGKCNNSNPARQEEGDLL